MTAIIAIVNQKGGVGKTTTAVTIAHGLAIEGLQALIVDMGSQGQIAASLGLTQQPGLYQLLVKDAGAQAVTDTGRANLHAILSDKETVSAAARVNEMRFREHVLTRALAGLEYDIIVLDTAPGADILQVNALLACTHFLIPTKLDHLSIEGTGATLATASSLQQLGALKAQFLGTLPTMWERTTSHTKKQFEILRQRFGSLLWPPIPQDSKAREATQLGRTLYEHACVGPAMSGRSTGNGLVGGYRRMVERLMEEMEL